MHDVPAEMVGFGVWRVAPCDKMIKWSCEPHSVLFVLHRGMFGTDDELRCFSCRFDDDKTLCTISFDPLRYSMCLSGHRSSPAISTCFTSERSPLTYGDSRDIGM